MPQLFIAAVLLLACALLLGLAPSRRRASHRDDTPAVPALTDALTGTSSRGYFEEALRQYLEEFRRIGRPVGLVILDLDHFGRINHTHGRHVGDEVLKAVGNCLKGVTRRHDVVARLGGEEFALLIPNADMVTMTRLAERIRGTIGGMAIVAAGSRFSVTASVGLALWDGEETAEALFRRADQQLYQAKNSGRNRVCA